MQEIHLPSAFSSVLDYRVRGRCLHQLGDILGLVLCGVLADCDDYDEIVDFGESEIAFLRESLGFSFPAGIPSADTLGRVLSRIKPTELEQCYLQCFGGLLLSGQLLNIDGKSLRGTRVSGSKQAKVQMVNAWCDDYKLSFGQTAVSDKSNEIPAILVLLSLFDCAGALVSIDAMGCQKEIAQTIVAQGGDYLLSLKANQPTLHSAVSAYMQKQKPALSKASSTDKGHGRLEIRHAYVAPCDGFILEAEAWTNLNTLIMIERERHIGNTVSTETAYYICSRTDFSAEDALQNVRSHWGVENGLHWQLDMTFKEDKSFVRQGNAPNNLHLIRKWSLKLLKDETDAFEKKTMSLKRKRKAIARKPELLKNFFHKNKT